MVIDHPAATRNAEPICRVVAGVIAELVAGLPRPASPSNGAQREGAQDEDEYPLRALELASGPGQHVELFARRFGNVHWQPTEPQKKMRLSIDERVRLAALGNVAPALELDARAAWPEGPFDLVMATNLTHISPWSVTEALVGGAAQALCPAGVLLLYGPYKLDGAHTSKGNAEFDLDLRSRDANWGVRDRESVAELGEEVGLGRMQVVDMPANNVCLLLRRG